MRHKKIFLTAIFIAVLPLAACDDDEATSTTEDTGSADTNTDTQPTNTDTGDHQDSTTADTTDTADTTEPPGLLPCLDHPSQALEPPTGSLPCTLLHPEFGR